MKTGKKTAPMVNKIFSDETLYQVPNIIKNKKVYIEELKRGVLMRSKIQAQYISTFKPVTKNAPSLSYLHCDEKFEDIDRNSSLDSPMKRQIGGVLLMNFHLSAKERANKEYLERNVLKNNNIFAHIIKSGVKNNR